MFGEIILVGVIASAIVEGIKKLFGTTGLKNKFASVATAIVLGGCYYFLKDTNIWVTILGILATSSTVYAFLLKK